MRTDCGMRLFYIVVRYRFRNLGLRLIPLQVAISFIGKGGQA